MRRRGAPLKVKNFGVQLFGRAYFAEELLPLVGQEVEALWDPEKLGELYLYSAERKGDSPRARGAQEGGQSPSRFICVAKIASSWISARRKKLSRGSARSSASRKGTATRATNK